MLRHNRAMSVALVAATSILLLAGAVPVHGQECHRDNLDLKGVWLHSVVSDGDAVLAVDPFNLRVLRLRPDGVESEFTALNLGSVSTPIAPTLLQKVASGRFLLGNGADQLVEVSAGNQLATKTGRGTGAFNARSKVRNLVGANEVGSLEGIFEWAAVGAGDTDDRGIIAFADVKEPDGAYRSGFVWFTANDPASFRFIEEVDSDSTEATFYFLLHPYIATIGSRAYFLRMT